MEGKQEAKQAEEIHCKRHEAYQEQACRRASFKRACQKAQQKKSWIKDWRQGQDFKRPVQEKKRQDRVDTSKSKVYITGIEFAKKDGSKALYPVHASNVAIEELAPADKKRMKIAGGKSS